MNTAWLRFYAELNDFLPRLARHQPLAHTFSGRTSVKDAIEAHGVPHTELDLILVNGVPVGFAHLLKDGDRVSVFPVFESIDIQPLNRLRPEPLRAVRFVLDTHLGRLATYLRLAGFDTAYARDASDDQLAAMSVGERRLLLTRDQALLKRRVITHGYYVRHTEPRQQLVEVLCRFDLARLMNPFARCLRCNAPLQAADRARVADRLPPRVREAFHEFRTCPVCDRVYWKGSHHDWMRLLLTRAVESAAYPRSASSRPRAIS